MLAVTQRHHQSGQSLSEYALILALIAAVCVGALTQLGTSITQSLNVIETSAGTGLVGDPDQL